LSDKPSLEHISTTDSLGDILVHKERELDLFIRQLEVVQGLGGPLNDRLSKTVNLLHRSQTELVRLQTECLDLVWAAKQRERYIEEHNAPTDKS